MFSVRCILLIFAFCKCTSCISYRYGSYSEEEVNKIKRVPNSDADELSDVLSDMPTTRYPLAREDTLRNQIQRFIADIEPEAESPRNSIQLQAREVEPQTLSPRHRGENPSMGRGSAPTNPELKSYTPSRPSSSFTDSRNNQEYLRGFVIDSDVLGDSLAPHNKHAQLTRSHWNTGNAEESVEANTSGQKRTKHKQHSSQWYPRGTTPTYYKTFAKKPDDIITGYQQSSQWHPKTEMDPIYQNHAMENNPEIRQNQNSQWHHNTGDNPVYENYARHRSTELKQQQNSQRHPNTAADTVYQNIAKPISEQAVAPPILWDPPLREEDKINWEMQKQTKDIERKQQEIRWNAEKEEKAKIADDLLLKEVERQKNIQKEQQQEAQAQSNAKHTLESVLKDMEKQDSGQTLQPVTMNVISTTEEVEPNSAVNINKATEKGVQINRYGMTDEELAIFMERFFGFE